MSLLLQAESEYCAFVADAEKKAGDYADECKKNQKTHIEGLKREWERFEQSENDRLAKTLLEAEARLEQMAADTKRRLEADQKKLAGAISGRLKGEVLSLYGSR